MWPWTRKVKVTSEGYNSVEVIKVYKPTKVSSMNWVPPQRTNLNPGGGIYEAGKLCFLTSHFTALVAFTVFTPFCMEITQPCLPGWGVHKYWPGGSQHRGLRQFINKLKSVSVCVHLSVKVTKFCVGGQELINVYKPTKFDLCIINGLWGSKLNSTAKGKLLTADGQTVFTKCFSIQSTRLVYIAEQTNRRTDEQTGWFLFTPTLTS